MEKFFRPRKSNKQTAEKMLATLEHYHQQADFLATFGEKHERPPALAAREALGAAAARLRALAKIL